MFVSMEHYDSVREVERAYPGAHSQPNGYQQARGK